MVGWRVCCGRDAGSCSGGMIVGDSARFWYVSARDRLRERSRRRAVIAPKNAREFGEAGEAGEVDETVGDVCESVDF